MAAGVGAAVGGALGAAIATARGAAVGAAVAAALKVGSRNDMSNKRLVVVLPSFGERYLSTSMFNSISSIQSRRDGYL